MNVTLSIFFYLSQYRFLVFWVYLGAGNCEIVFFFFALFSLFYVTGEFHRFLHRGRASFFTIFMLETFLVLNFQPPATTTPASSQSETGAVKQEKTVSVVRNSRAGIKASLYSSLGCL